MKVNKNCLQIAMAAAEKSAYDIGSISARTYYRAIAGENLKPKTIGRLAKELGVEVSELVSKGEGNE